MDHTKKAIAAIGAVILFVFLAIPAYAFKFNIDSPRIELKVNPGEKAVGYITVDSYEYNEDLSINIYLEDVIYLPDGTNDYTPRGTTDWSLGDWIKIEPQQLILRGNSAAKIKYSVKVPPDARGGRYGVIFFEVKTPFTETADYTSRSAVRLGSVITVMVKGTAEYQAELKELKAVFEKDVLKASFLIKNTGNLLIRPKGDLVIMDREGVVIAKKDANPNQGGVLPSTSRNFETVWKPGEVALEKDRGYVAEVTLDCGGESLLGGQANLKVTNE